MQIKISIFIIYLLLSIIFLGCSGINRETALPAVKVVFLHYNINGTHILEIKNTEPVFIPINKAPELYVQPPVPGIHVYAYVFEENRRYVTPTTYLPIYVEGENITAYIGFASPKDVPKNGSVLLVVVDVVSVADGRAQIIATSYKRLVWHLK